MTTPTTPPTAWLVRHAATSWTGVRWCGRADPPLTPAGRLAADALARQLATEIAPGTLVLTSPAARARQTAEPIAAALGSQPLVLDELIEVDVGRAEGLTWMGLSVREPELASAIASGAAVDWPGGESATQVSDRAAAAAARIAEAALGRPVVVVSHGAFLHALAGILGGPADRVPLDAAGVLRIGS
ncbi:MAG TPA: histidine phosphatase family protein [Candidatus Limnocylindrales bacterium]|nr:histidine phosphatase family protein [Candidatus Limnocylindrales bacterium]